jgi:hypothetical protein
VTRKNQGLIHPKASLFTFLPCSVGDTQKRAIQEKIHFDRDYLYLFVVIFGLGDCVLEKGLRREHRCPHSLTRDS